MDISRQSTYCITIALFKPSCTRFMDLEEDLFALLRRQVDLVTKRILKGNIGKRILSEVVEV